MSRSRDPIPSSTPAPHRAAEPKRGETAANELAGRSGTELPVNVRQTMESRFDADFSNVRVHSDRAATEATGALGARAFTLGQHIAFNAGEYSPMSKDGQRLIAHELTHVVQQRDATGGHAELRRDAGDEREAAHVADGATRGQAAQAGTVRRTAPLSIQADEPKKTDASKDDTKADATAKPAAGGRITFVLRAPDDSYTKDVTDYVKNTLNEQVVEVDNIQEAAEYVAKYSKEHKTKVSEIRIVAHGSTTGGIKMTPKGETGRRFVTAQELEEMSADQKLKSTASGAMADGATVEFWGCNVGRSETTGKAVSNIFGGAEFKSIEDTLRTSSDSFARQADAGEEGQEVNTKKGKVKVVEAKTTKEIDDRVAKGDKALGDSFDKWLVQKAQQAEADGDIPAQPDDAARIKTMRGLFDRSNGKIKRLEIHTDKETLHKGDKKKWLGKWKTTKVN